MKLLKLVGDILLEYMGNQVDVNKLEDIVMDNVMNNDALIGLLSSFTKFFYDDYDSVLLTTTVQDLQIIKNTKIKKVKTNIRIKSSDQTTVGGSFNEYDVILLDGNVYQISIIINISLNPKDISTIRPEISKVVAHELHHAFRDIKLKGKQSKAYVYNFARSLMGLGFGDVLKDNPQLKEFMFMFYLGLPQEITARVQETASELKNINTNDTNDVIQALLRYQPLNDAKKMINYEPKIIETINYDILKIFVFQFNTNIDVIAKKMD